MKYRKQILAGGVILAIIGVGSAVALQPAPKPIHTAVSAYKAPPKPQFQPQVTTYTDPPAQTAQAAPTAASTPATDTAATVPASTCNAADQQALNVYRNDLVLWTASMQSQGRNADVTNPYNVEGRILTSNINNELAKGCQ